MKGWTCYPFPPFLNLKLDVILFFSIILVINIQYNWMINFCSLQIPPNSAGLIEYRAHPFWLQKYCPSHERDGTPRCCSCQRMEVSYNSSQNMSSFVDASHFSFLSLSVFFLFISDMKFSNQCSQWMPNICCLMMAESCVWSVLTHLSWILMNANLSMLKYKNFMKVYIWR